jgi:hypothetical protein
VAPVKAVFFIPLKDNDGRDLSAEIMDLETALYVTFVGWTITGTVKGMYQRKTSSLLSTSATRTCS